QSTVTWLLIFVIVGRSSAMRQPVSAVYGISPLGPAKPLAWIVAPCICQNAVLRCASASTTSARPSPLTSVALRTVHPGLNGGAGRDALSNPPVKIASAAANTDAEA